ncbi:MAG TPA: DUF3037 domain-containing protein [Dehalococcoidia bacterium]|nr:DUF3037 domain-containing protein [Dehalococcoidia bacterium]
MPSYYSVIQYVPDPIADERLNVGVVVFSEGHTRIKFVNDWQRARAFAGSDVSFLREFAKRAQVEAGPQHPLLPDIRHWNETIIRDTLGRWKNSVQFTDPRASLKDADALLREVGARFLRPPRRRNSGFRTKQAAVALGREKIGEALEHRFGHASDKVLRRGLRIEGELDEHPVDLVVQNGHALFGAQGISFEIPDQETILREVRVLAWAIDDIRNRDKEFPFGVIALPPKVGSRTMFRRAEKILAGLGAEMLSGEDEVRSWAETRVAVLA